MIIFGLSHGLFILPAIFSFIGPSNQDPPRDSNPGTEEKSRSSREPETPVVKKEESGSSGLERTEMR